MIKSTNFRDSNCNCLVRSLFCDSTFMWRQFIRQPLGVFVTGFCYLNSVSSSKTETVQSLLCIWMGLQKTSQSHKVEYETTMELLCFKIFNGSF